MKSRNFTLLLVIICSVFFITSCKQAPTMHGQAEYKTTKVSAQDITLPTSYSATIKGRQDIDIYPQVSGTLTQVCVNEGQVVKKGQTLFVIDQVPYKAALETATSAVQLAKSSLSTAQLTFDSKQKLFDNKVISAFDLQTAKNSLEAAKASLSQAQAQEVNAKNNLSYTVVKSPSDGVVGTLPYRVGALVSANIQKPLTVVSDNSQMYVYFSITENQLLDYTQEFGSMDKAIASFPSVKLMLNNGTEYTNEGKIESISGVLDSQTGAATVRAVFPNEGRLLHSGFTGNVVFPHNYTGRIVIPQVATVKMQDKVLVYKVIDGKAVSQLIKVSPISNGQEYIVLEGLNEGDEIIAEGAGLVREGTQVK